MRNRTEEEKKAILEETSADILASDTSESSEINEKKQTKKRKKKMSLLTIFFLIIAIAAGSYLIYHQWQSHLATAQFEELAEMNQDTLKKKYKDMVAWVKIKNTNIDYPVMECPPNDSQYWLRRNVKGNYSINGTLFMDPNGDIENSYNLLIYGHNMTDGSMFGQLGKFEDNDFIKKHKKIHVVKWFHDGTHTEGDYEIFAYYKNSIYDSENHLDYADIETKETFDKYIKYCKRVSTYKSKVKPEFGDDLVTLSTCSYHVLGRDGRQVVVAVRKAGN